jgi:glyoxylase-like metal-dependent hydrolase (beta-lactamase superfamily II)/rhodanese-related sulfurtransferase
MNDTTGRADSCRIVTIETTGLGDRTYLAHDGTHAVVVDPQRDIDRVLDVAAGLGVQIAVVAETHIHNDYVTGGLALSACTGATYLVAASEEVDFDRTPATDGESWPVGTLTLTALATPGHTPGHLSYVVADAGGVARAVFTGGSMLYGSVGRTDLIGDEHTEDLTRAQYHSVRRLAELLDDDVEVLPTHGFGSFCAASPTGGTASTVGDQRGANLALVTDDEDRFVRELLAGLVDHPGYYARMGPINRRGPGAADLSVPRLVDAATIQATLADGGYVVDLRHRRAFAAAHVTGTLCFELGDPLATYLGWTIPWGAELTLVGETAEDVVAARRQLARIGIDDLAGHAVGEPGRWTSDALRSYPVASFVDLAAVLAGAGDPVIIDVRRPDEWAQSHIPGSHNQPLGGLGEAMDDLPDGHLWVHCAAGYRAAVAASFLDRAGRNVTLIDDAWAHAVSLGLAG